nr:hypothetical protein [Clostridiales bacterium]
MRKTVNACIAVIFIICICTVTVLTLSEYGRKYAYGFFKSYKDRLDDDSDIFDNAEARIYKLNYNAENRLWGRDALRHLTVRFQMALPGKDIVSIGGASMVHLTSGGYYNLMDGPLVQSKIDDITEFAEKAADMSGAKTLFVYCHCALFEDGLLPGDTRYLDNNGTFADEMLASLSA